MSNRIKYTPEMFREFARDGYSKYSMAKQLKVSSSTIYQKCKVDETCETAWNEGRQEFWEDFFESGNTYKDLGSHGYMR